MRHGFCFEKYNKQGRSKKGRSNKILFPKSCSHFHFVYPTQPISMRKLLTGLLLLPALLRAQPSHLAELNATDVSCHGNADGVLQVALLEGAAPASFQWTRLPNSPSGAGTLDAANPVASVLNLPPGAYRVTLTDATGADTLLYSIIAEPEPLSGDLSILTDFNGYEVSCAGNADGRLRANIAGGTPYYAYAWSAGNENHPVADSLAVGEHRLSVTDSRGCVLELSVTLTAPPPLTTQVEAAGEKCYGENTGAITLWSVAGGLPPYLAALDGAGFDAQTAWANVPPGSHFLVVEDANGCRHTDAVLLPTGFQFTFDAGSDTTLLAGDSLHLLLESDKVLDTVLWTPAASVVTVFSESATLFPLFTTHYRATAVDLNGCKAVDDFTVTVHRDRDVYAPNAFAPNGQNGDNRAFTLYGGAGIHTVAVLQVFDRFGKLIFENRDFPVNDPASGWQGLVWGETGPPGVYVWHAVVAFTDGREEIYQGDVLLMR